MRRVKIEICAYSLESCRTAQRLGVDSVELCSSPSEGGLTPSFATITMARQILITPLLYVMIRPRGGDFVYSDDEFISMKIDIETARTAGADGVVFGLLNSDAELDTLRTKELVAIASPMRVTFHRAFDMTHNPISSLEAIIESGCQRILTSGGHQTAIQGADTLRLLAKHAHNKIEIIAGSGVDSSQIKRLFECGIHGVHLSAKATRDSVMKYRNPCLSMGGIESVSEYKIIYADASKIESVISSIEKLTDK